MNLTKSEILEDTDSVFLISLDRNPTLIVRTLEQVNETNLSKAFTLKGWEMNQESEGIINADKSFIKSFLGNNAPFSKYALLRRTTCGKSFGVQIQKLPLMAIEILDMPGVCPKCANSGWIYHGFNTRETCPCHY